MTLGSGLSCRVVSAEVKPLSHQCLHRPRLSGELEVEGQGRRHCSVQTGCLEVLTGASSAVLSSASPVLRLPLRGLHLVSAGRLAFSLIGQGSSLTFKADKEEEYCRWVRCLAAELLRQTPLTRLPYLDILGITGTLRRAQSEGCLSAPPVLASAQPQPLSPLPDVVVDTCRPRPLMRSAGGSEGGVEVSSGGGGGSHYLPVRERRRLWEELCRGGTSGHHRYKMSAGGSPLQQIGGSLTNLNEASSCLRFRPPHHHLSVRQLARLFESSTASLPPRLSSHYIRMKENNPGLLNSLMAREDGEEESGSGAPGGRGRKQLRLSQIKLRHHSNIR